MWDIDCPYCGHNWDDPTFDLDACPNCDARYYYDEDCLEDYSDCWSTYHFWKEGEE